MLRDSTLIGTFLRCSNVYYKLFTIFFCKCIQVYCNRRDNLGGGKLLRRLLYSSFQSNCNIRDDMFHLKEKIGEDFKTIILTFLDNLADFLRCHYKYSYFYLLFSLKFFLNRVNPYYDKYRVNRVFSRKTSLKTLRGVLFGTTLHCEIILIFLKLKQCSMNNENLMPATQSNHAGRNLCEPTKKIQYSTMN